MVKRRKMVPKMIPQQGAGILDILKSFAGAVAPVAHNFVKDNRLISRGLSAAGIPGLPMVASALGYGRRKPRAGGRRRRPKVIFH